VDVKRIVGAFRQAIDLDTVIHSRNSGRKARHSEEDVRPDAAKSGIGLVSAAAPTGIAGSGPTPEVQ
jgi:hypothetical protein